MSIQIRKDADTTNTYWEGTGKYQDMYNKMVKEVETGKWDWNKTTRFVFFRYYRFYNDGDCPPSMKYKLGDYAKSLEEKADDRVLKEWKRFIKRDRR